MLAKLLTLALLTAPPPIPGERTEPPPPIPAKAKPAVVVPAQPFRVEFRESHNCPRCGALVLVKAGRGPERASHLHRCPYCGVAWWHYDK